MRLLNSIAFLLIVLTIKEPRDVVASEVQINPFHHKEPIMAVYKVSPNWRSPEEKGKRYTQVRTWALFCCDHCSSFFIRQPYGAENAKSCGCYSGKLISKGMENNKRGFKHGMAESRILKVWSAMKERCENVNNKHYANYGGRGIQVCDRWKIFSNFVADMGVPQDGLCIDRIDNNKGYNPENCRWTTRKENQRNRRVTKTACIDGVEKPLMDWVDEIGVVSDSVARSRINSGWDHKQALTTPLQFIRRKNRRLADE